MQDARVLVAGASGDIGRAIAIELLQAGAEVLMLGRSRERLAAGRLPESRHTPEYLALDLTDLVAVARAGAEIVGSGKLDVLVLSSGIYVRSQDPETFRRQLDANLTGPYALLQAILPILIERKGQIIFLNSSQALSGAAGVGQYAATKHAAKAIADSLRAEVNERGVRVTSLYLGRTAGERQREIFNMEGRPYHPESLIQPCDIARTVIYLLQMPRTVEVTDVLMRPMQKV
jgi:NADP-dependent 3-hydroxy acid dehydrogenase YdfG